MVYKIRTKNVVYQKKYNYVFGISVFLDKKVGNDLTCTLYLEYSTIIYRTPLWVHARERKKDKKKVMHTGKPFR